MLSKKRASLDDSGYESDTDTTPLIVETEEDEKSSSVDGKSPFLKRLVGKRNTNPLPVINPCYDENQDNVDDSSNEEYDSYVIQVDQSSISYNSNDLLEAVKKAHLKKFIEHLKKVSDITAGDGKGNNVLHFIASQPREQKVIYLGLILKTEIPKDQLSKAIDAKNGNGLTPLQIALSAKMEKKSHKHNTISDLDNTLKFIITLLEHGANCGQLKLPEKYLKELSSAQQEYYHKFLNKLDSKLIEFPSSKKAEITRIIDGITYGQYPLHSAIGNKDEFSRLLQNGYDITAQDEKGDNVLHLIASRPKEQKVIYLDLILKAGIPEDQLSKAIGDKNKEELTPMQTAIVNKILKSDSTNILLKNMQSSSHNKDNTVNFCIGLLNHLTLSNNASSQGCCHHFILSGGYSNDKYIEFLKDLTKNEKISGDHRKYILENILGPKITKKQENEDLRSAIKKRATNTNVSNYSSDSSQSNHHSNKFWAKARRYASSFGRSICGFVDPNKTVNKMTKLATIALAVITALFTFIVIAFAAVNGQLPMALAVPVMLAFMVIPMAIKYFQNSKDGLKNQGNKGLDNQDNSTQDKKESSNHENPNSDMTNTLTDQASRCNGGKSDVNSSGCFVH